MGWMCETFGHQFFEEIHEEYRTENKRIEHNRKVASNVCQRCGLTKEEVKQEKAEKW